MIQIYRFILAPLLIVVLFLLKFFNRKLARGWAMRARDAQGLAPWQMGERRRRPIWIHCASGEFEYAKPVLELLRTRHPEIPRLVTFFSPSIEKAITYSPLVDIACPMPWDRPKAWAEFLNHHQPRMLLIARTDTWPEMLEQAALRNVPSLLFSATLTESSGRMSFFARPLSRWLFSKLSQIFCVSDADFEQFDRLGVGEKTSICGDTRFDQVQARLRNPQNVNESHFQGSIPRLIAGSTWPEDESVLLEVIPKFISRIQWVLVPHEPTPEHLQELELKLNEAKITHIRYSQNEMGMDGAISPPSVLIIDQIGILAELYLKGRFAFVGGSYRKTVHSVMEPLAAGCLTLVGPKIQNNREALEFSAISLAPQRKLSPVEICKDAHAMTARLERALLEFDEAARLEIQKDIRARSGKTALVCDWMDVRLESGPALH